MSDFNYVSFFGHIVRDAEMKVMSNGVKITEFTVANNTSVKKGDISFEDKPSFIPLAIYGDYAQKMLPYLKKAQKVIVEGRIRQDKWEKEGKKMAKLSISVKRLQLISGSKTSPEELKNSEENEKVETEFYPENDLIMDQESSEIFFEEPSFESNV